MTPSTGEVRMVSQLSYMKKKEKQDCSNRMNTTNASHFFHALLAQPPVSRGDHQTQDT
jgi:hypothetical protein